jgi:hypothetical protein
MTDAVTEREPPIRPDADLRQIGAMPVDVDAILALAKNVPAEAFRATMLLWGAAWHQVPAGSLVDDDAALCAMAGLERPVWETVRDRALQGFAKCSDGRLYDPLIVEKALTVLADVERREKRKADDRRRAKLCYDRKTGKAPPKPNAAIPRDTGDCRHDIGDCHDDATSAAPPPSPPPSATVSSQPNGHSTSHVDEVRAEKPHANGQAAPTAIAARQHEAAIIKVDAEPKLTIAEWDAEVQKYRISGDWSWRSLGPSPRFPTCRAPFFVLHKHGYGG